MNAPPGWYDDGQGRTRWWTGTEWGEQVLPAGVPIPAVEVVPTDEVEPTVEVETAEDVEPGTDERLAPDETDVDAEPVRDPEPEPERAQPTIAAGWYDDGSGRERWWDGSRWTRHRRQPAAGTVVEASENGEPELILARRPWVPWMVITVLSFAFVCGFFFWPAGLVVTILSGLCFLAVPRMLREKYALRLSRDGVYPSMGGRVDWENVESFGVAVVRANLFIRFRALGVRIVDPAAYVESLSPEDLRFYARMGKVTRVAAVASLAQGLDAVNGVAAGVKGGMDGLKDGVELFLAPQGALAALRKSREETGYDLVYRRLGLPRSVATTLAEINVFRTTLGASDAG